MTVIENLFNSLLSARAKNSLYDYFVFSETTRVPTGRDFPKWLTFQKISSINLQRLSKQRGVGEKVLRNIKEFKYECQILSDKSNSVSAPDIDSDFVIGFQKSLSVKEKSSLLNILGHAYFLKKGDELKETFDYSISVNNGSEIGSLFFNHGSYFYKKMIEMFGQEHFPTSFFFSRLKLDDFVQKPEEVYIIHKNNINHVTCANKQVAHHIFEQLSISSSANPYELVSQKYDPNIHVLNLAWEYNILQKLRNDERLKNQSK